MAKTPKPFLSFAFHSPDANAEARAACGSTENYVSVKKMGLSDEQIIANFAAENEEELVAAQEEIDPEIARRLSTENIRFGDVSEAMAIVARLEENDCE